MRPLAQKLGQALGLAAVLLLTKSTGLSKPELSGEQIYSRLCAKCHGDQGEGVANEHDEPLVGDWSIEKLTRVIIRTMPDDEPKQCVGNNAKRVARYIYDTFYSPDAQVRNKPPRIELARLTNRQYLHSVADLIGSFTGQSEFGQAGGLKAGYYNSRNHSRNKHSLERTDATVDFQYGGGTPAPDNKEYKAEEFSMRWSGSVFAEETGDHEFIVTSENGVRLWVNNMDLKLIEGWVSSGELRELNGTIRLIGGRAYPLRLDFFKYKSRSASVKLEWHPPHRARQVIPARSLSPASTRSTFVMRQPFPPDDSSAGYERGSAVSKQWDEAATFAAIEAANWVAEHLDPLAGTSATDKDRLAKTRAFSHQFAKRAFRRPLDAEQQRFFIDSRFAGRKPVTDSVKEVVLLTLKSPRFLYPDLGQADDYSVATRLALGLWDSMPDDELLRAAAAGRLNTPDEARQQALRMLRDSRSRAKLRDTFHHWLGIDHAEEIAKDTEQYPNYDKSLEADLRTSLNIFLDNIVWRTAGADFRKLLNSRHLPFNERLARFYGAQRVKHHGEFGPSFFDHERAGLLTHPYLLALYSYHNTTSPIHRGVFITRHVLGRSLKPPPEAVVFKDGAFAPDMTMREKVTQLTKADACMTCHGIINPLGFALEQFDGIGRLRDTEKGRPINTISDYLSADGSTVRLTSAGDLARHATESPSAQNGFIEMLFNQVAKQPVRAYGSGVLNRLRGDFAASGFNVQFLLAETAVINALNGIDSAQSIERN
jgi:hypothetical protein